MSERKVFHNTILENEFKAKWDSVVSSLKKVSYDLSKIKIVLNKEDEYDARGNIRRG